MPLSRTNRIDRRRRVMLDAVAADSEYAVETVRAKKRMRSRELQELSDDDGYTTNYRDPGYSQAVRKTCQQRLVQLIPVRRGTLTVVLMSMWLMWGALLFAHYWIYVRTPVTSDVAADAATKNGFEFHYVSALFHLRSSYSIAHWLTGQLWTFTAIAAWMIFQLRRHKLDDYRARYRIWAVLAVVAVFSSFDASCSFLYLVGQTIDKWAFQEIGYRGWPLVLASFASIVGVLGIRLCSELRTAPTSVACWMLGLLAWGASALMGTGLIKTSLSDSSVDLFVGACWLGGILAVFQAAGIYLRQTYIHAQKRFLQRQGANLAPIQWKVPKISLRRPRDPDDISDDELDRGSKRKWKMPWKRRSKQNGFDNDRESDRDDSSHRGVAAKTSQRSEREAPKANSAASNSSSQVNAQKPVSSSNKSERYERDSDKADKADRDESPRFNAKTKGRLFGWIPNRHEQNERLEAEPLREDDNIVEDRGLTKARGWFGIGGNRGLEPDNKESKRKTASSDRDDSVPTTAAKPSSQKSPSADATKERRSFWSKRSDPNKSNQPERDSQDSNELNPSRSKRKWLPKFGKGAKSSDGQDAAALKAGVSDKKSPTAKTSNDKEQPKAGEKRSWFGSKKEKSPAAVVDKKADSPKSDNESSKAGKRGFFGMFDGLKLNPPADDSKPANSASTNKPVKPVPVQSGQALPSTRGEIEEDDSDDQYSGRPMSKAERKKMRRMQQDDRRAA